MEAEAFDSFFLAILFIPSHRTSSVCKVDSDLIFSSGEEFNFKKAEVFGFLQERISGLGQFAFFGIFNGVHIKNTIFSKI